MESIKVKNECELLSLQPLDDTSPRQLSMPPTAVSLGEGEVTMQETEQDPLMLYRVCNSVDNSSPPLQQPLSSQETLTYATLNPGDNFILQPQVSEASMISERTSGVEQNGDCENNNTLVVVREVVDGDTMAYIYIQGEADASENQHDIDSEQAHTITLNSVDGSTLHTLPASYTQHLEHTYGDLVLVNGSSGAVTDNEGADGTSNFVENIQPDEITQEKILLLSVQNIKLEDQNNTSEILSLPSSPRLSKAESEGQVSGDVLESVISTGRNIKESVNQNDKLLKDTIEERIATRDSLLPAKVHRPQSYVCSVCQMTFKSSFKFNAHQAVHKGHNIWHCDICKFKCDTFADLKQHKNFLHKDARPFKCHLCEMKFSKRIILDNHVRSVHNKERPHSCSFCGKGFYRPHDLKMHLNLHLGIKSNVCHICGRVFTHPSNLIRHQRLHSGIKPYVCPTCGKRFSQLILLFRHRTTHQPETGVCPMCPSTFRSAAGLKKHYKVEHKKSLTLQEATRVIRGHGGVIGRRYYCQICGDSFLIRADLKKHEKKEHGNSTLAVCSSCNQTFAAEDLKSHICFGAEESEKGNITHDTPLKQEPYAPEIKVIMKSNLKSYDKNKQDRKINCSSCHNYLDADDLQYHVCNNSEYSKHSTPYHRDKEDEYLVMHITAEGMSCVMKKKEDSSLDKVLQINAPVEENLIDSNVLRPTLPEDSLMINVQEHLSFNQPPENSPMAVAPINDDGNTLITHINHSSSGLHDSKIKCNPESHCLQTMEVESRSHQDAVNLDSQVSSPDFERKSSVSPFIDLNSTHSGIKIEKKSGLRSIIMKNSQDSSFEVKQLKMENYSCEPSLNCLVCGKSFQKQWNYQQHIATHNPALHRYKCEICGLTFAYRSTYTSHMKKHSSVTNVYTCSICKKTYKSAMSLNVHHRRDHLQIRPYSCTLCKKEFFSKSDFKYHMRLHNKEQPYICYACGREFSHVSHLHRHERTHTGDRPHKCTYCPKEFIQLVSLKIHLKKHIKDAGETLLAGNESNHPEDIKDISLRLPHSVKVENSMTTDRFCDASKPGISTVTTITRNKIKEALHDTFIEPDCMDTAIKLESTDAKVPLVGEGFPVEGFPTGTVILTSGNLDVPGGSHQYGSDTGSAVTEIEECIAVPAYLLKKIQG
ncbi:hypothetical protein SK128_024365 [Halocaridina rubra]|uniref:C2H2-type domain-containing protein n=1 Tax=Halocaridina rubra TaxID=373956 RepID=A0AAN8WID2_HALRR